MDGSDGLDYEVPTTAAFSPAAVGSRRAATASAAGQDDLFLMQPTSTAQEPMAPVVSAELGFPLEGAAEVGLGSSSQTSSAPLPPSGTTVARGKAGGLREA